MMILKNIRDFINNASRQEIIQWSTIYVAICTLIMTSIIIRHVMTDHALNQKIKQLNKTRQQLQKTFSQFLLIQTEKNKLDELLTKNKNFNIQKYAQDLSTQERITSQTTTRFETEKLSNGYVQESILINITLITTQQLCQLLTQIEQQPLVSISFIDITNLPQSKKINVSIKLTTLRFED